MTIKRPWYFRYLFGALRKIWRWSPDRRKTLNDAKDGLKYTCSDCKGRFDRSAIAVDHKEPVISPNEGFTGWDTYIARLFCAASGLQVLCKPCHKGKTKAENKTRRQVRDARKKAA